MLETLYKEALDRKKNPKEGSYTNYLFDKGLDKILKKVGEEATEVVIGAKNANWKCIWLNKKGLKAMDIKPDYEVNDEEALLNLISKIVKESAQKM